MEKLPKTASNSEKLPDRNVATFPLREWSLQQLIREANLTPIQTGKTLSFQTASSMVHFRQCQLHEVEHVRNHLNTAGTIGGEKLMRDTESRVGQEGECVHRILHDLYLHSAAFEQQYEAEHKWGARHKAAPKSKS